MNVRNWVIAKKNVLICGASGVGKSHFVKEIAEKLNKEFLQLNVSNLSAELVESELFGHTKGSFSGAFSDRAGLCETIGEGILFLDEIGELNKNLQPKLLTLLEEGEFRPIGSNKVKKFNGCIILATHQNLKEKVEKGLFRKDLYYRLSTFQYALTDLKSRKEYNNIIKNKIDLLNDKSLSPSLEDFLYSYHWPGNFRELNNLFEYLSLSDEKLLTKRNLPLNIKEKKTFLKENDKNYYKSLELFERDYFKSALHRVDFNITKCSQTIGISKVTLISKIKKYNLGDYIKLNKSLRNT